MRGRWQVKGYDRRGCHPIVHLGDVSHLVILKLLVVLDCARVAGREGFGGLQPIEEVIRVLMGLVQYTIGQSRDVAGRVVGVSKVDQVPRAGARGQAVGIRIVGVRDRHPIAQHLRRHLPEDIVGRSTNVSAGVSLSNVSGRPNAS